jgi:hypothetical protein
VALLFNFSLLSRSPAVNSILQSINSILGWWNRGIAIDSISIDSIAIDSISIDSIAIDSIAIIPTTNERMERIHSIAIIIGGWISHRCRMLILLSLNISMILVVLLLLWLRLLRLLWLLLLLLLLWLLLLMVLCRVLLNIEVSGHSTRVLHMCAGPQARLRPHLCSHLLPHLGAVPRGIIARVSSASSAIISSSVVIISSSIVRSWIASTVASTVASGAIRGSATCSGVIRRVNTRRATSSATSSIMPRVVNMHRV